MALSRARLQRQRSGLIEAHVGSYRAADNPRNKSVGFLGGSGDTHADDRSRQYIRELARQLERNAHTYSVLMNRWLDCMGVPMPRFMSSDPVWNEKKRQQFNDRACLRAGGFDARGLETWGGLARQLFGAVGRDGDVAVLKIADGTLSLVESDCIAGGPRTANQYMRTVGSIAVDLAGKPMRAYICGRNSGGFADTANAQAYDWGELEYFANRTRHSQTRGMPPLVAGLDDFERGDSLLESTVIQAEQAANVYGVITKIREDLAKAQGAGLIAPVTGDGKPAPLDTGASNVDLVPDYVAAARGALLMLYDDQDFKQVKNENPNLNVPPFMTFLLRMHALGLSFPYELAFMDLGHMSWSGHKTLITLGRDGLSRWRTQIFEPALHGIATWWLQRTIAAEGGEAPADWNRIGWDWPELPWPDPMKEEQTNALALQNRTNSRRRITRHWREIQDECSEEERYQDSLLVARIAALQQLCNAQNTQVPKLNLHWSHIITAPGALTAPGAYLQAANPAGAQGGDNGAADDGSEDGSGDPKTTPKTDPVGND